MDFVGNRSSEARVPRLELKNGKFSIWQGATQPALEFDFAQGRLLGIDIRKRKTSSGEMTYCDFHFTHGEECFDISTIASSCVTADLVSRIANVKDIAHSELRIDAWRNDRFTNVQVKENGAPVPFTALPKVAKNDNGFKVVIDSSERDATVMRLIDEINAKIHESYTGSSC